MNRFFKVFFGLISIVVLAIILSSFMNVWNYKHKTKSLARDGRMSKYANVIIEPITFLAHPGCSGSKRVARKGVLFRKPGARATVLICHGFMCDKTDVRFLRMVFKDYNVMTFDFRAHGESKGSEYCTFGCDEVHDIRAAAEFIKSDRKIGKLPLVVYGFSMGAVSSINAQSKDQTLFDCAIWDCPFDSTGGVLSRSIDQLSITIFGYTFPMPGRSFLKKFAYNCYVQAMLKAMLKTIAQLDAQQVNTRILPVDTTQTVKKVKIPSLFIVCKNDKKSPPDGVRKVYEGAQGYKRLWITNGRRHFDSFFYNPEKYSYKVRRFIEKFLDNKFSNKVQQKVSQDRLEE